MKKCPSDAIMEKIDSEGFRYPKVVLEKCIDCRLCEETCPVLNAPTSKKTATIIDKNVYAVINKDGDIRQDSSSGGVFDALARKIIENDGVVYGAAMSDDQYECSHIRIDSTEGLQKLHGSKYLQSDISGCYDEIDSFLKMGKTVLFTGTPCQINALQRYVSGDTGNLFCAEVVCHGVPSSYYWKKYIDEIEEKNKAKVVESSFRTKNSLKRSSSRDGWGLLLKFDNGKVIKENSLKNRYLQAFIHNVMLRPSCHKCIFKYLEREADISLGDFWGCEKIFKDFDDGKGVSLVITHTKKGETLLDELDGEICCEKSDISTAIAFNSPLILPVSPHKKRSEFIEGVRKVGFTKTVNQILLLDIFIDNIKCYLKKLIGR